MKQTFKAKNIACSSCANLIKTSLKKEFGEIEVNLDVEPREVSIDLKDEKEKINFSQKMQDLGFELIKK